MYQNSSLCLQMFCLLEADQGHHISPDQLYMAIASWLVLADSAAANQRWQSCQALLAQWTPAQLQTVFQKAVKLVQQHPEAAAWAIAERACILAAVQKAPKSAQQVHELVQALLLNGKHEAALKVIVLAVLLGSHQLALTNLAKSYFSFMFWLLIAPKR